MFILQEFIGVLLSFITQTVNASLLQGRLPDSQKHAIFTPLLKKPGLDTAHITGSPAASSRVNGVRRSSAET